MAAGLPHSFARRMLDMKQNELEHIARLIDERALQCDGNALAPKPSSIDAAICLALGFTPTTPEMASKLARVAAALRGLDASDPDVERLAILRAGVNRAVRLPVHIRERMRELCALPFTVPAPQAQPKRTPRRDDRSAVARIEFAIENELRKPLADQRPHLIRKWRDELALHDDTYSHA